MFETSVFGQVGFERCCFLWRGGRVFGRGRMVGVPIFLGLQSSLVWREGGWWAGDCNKFVCFVIGFCQLKCTRKCARF